MGLDGSTSRIARHKNKGGAPLGNSNARKHGFYTAQERTRRAEIRVALAKAQSLLLLAERILRKREKARAMRARLKPSPHRPSN